MEKVAERFTIKKLGIEKPGIKKSGTKKPGIEKRKESFAKATRSSKISRGLNTLILGSSSRKRSVAYLVILGLLAYVRFVFLGADFPIDLGGYGMAYTDEGWWSRNAVAWVREGSWYIDDGYNTITNLPVLPIIQIVWFKLFGVGLVSARAISVVCSLLVSGGVYLLARRELSVSFAWIAPFIVLTDYSVFVYSRLALLEMPMLVFLLASLWLATAIQKGVAFNAIYCVVLSGLCFTLAILTKTTALFALPVIAIALFFQMSSSGEQSSQETAIRQNVVALNPAAFRLRLLLIWLLAVGVSLGICYLILNQAGDVASQTYFSNHNVAAKVPQGLFNFIKGPARVIKRSFTLYPLLFPGLLGAIALLAKAGKTKSSPLFRIVVLWTGAALCAFSLSDFAAPRYFLVLTVPIALAIPLWLESVWHRSKSEKVSLHRSLHRSLRRPLLGTLVALAFSASTALSLFNVGSYLWRPQFTLIETANTINKYVASEESRSNTLLGHFADTIALATDDIEAVNDRMGFQPLDDRLKTFDPGYYVSIGPIGSLGKKIDLEIQTTLENNYQLVLLNKFELFQKQDFGQPVFFYRLDPL